jgi:hypothetical protein
MARRSLALGERSMAADAVSSALVSFALSGWPGTGGASIRYVAAVDAHGARVNTS